MTAFTSRSSASAQLEGVTSICIRAHAGSKYEHEEGRHLKQKMPPSQGESATAEDADVTSKSSFCTVGSYIFTLDP